MLALMMLSSIAALLFVYIFMPALWLSIMAFDESLDAHEAGLAVVASSKLLPLIYLLNGRLIVNRKSLSGKWSSC